MMRWAAPISCRGSPPRRVTDAMQGTSSVQTAAPYVPAAPSMRQTVVIGAEKGSLASKVFELWHYRELFYFLVWRDVKVRYAQSILGIGWALIQPLVPMILFTVIFGRVARISSDGMPYALFSLTGLVPWIYISNALNDSSGSLVKEVNMLSKIYFPRLIIPLTSVLGRLIDLGISFLALFVLMAWYRTVPPTSIALLPAPILVAIMAVSGIGMRL